MEINKSNGITNVNVKNIFGCSRVTFNGNIHFYYDLETEDDTTHVYFFIINDSNFHLDTENIKKKPVMLFYLFSEFMDEKKPNIILNRFEDNNYENPLLFDIEKYMGKKKDTLSYGKSGLPKPLMKFGEHFFTLYLVDPIKEQGYNSEVAIYNILYFNIPFFIYSFYQCFKNDNYILILPCIIAPIVIYLLIASCFKCCSKDTRIDFIYSKNFERIFIGVVNYKLNGYSKTFEYQTDEIDRFGFLKPENINGPTSFVVILKNKIMSQIIRCKGIDRYDQEGIEFILNGKLNKQE